jgi:hypothetical protein
VRSFFASIGSRAGHGAGSRREGRHAAEIHLLALGQRVADAQRAVVGDADDVAGPGLLGHLAFLGEEEQRRVDRHLLAGPDLAQPHALGQPPAAQPHEGDAVAVVGVHVGLDLEHEAGTAVPRPARSRGSAARARRRA